MKVYLITLQLNLLQRRPCAVAAPAAASCMQRGAYCSGVCFLHRLHEPFSVRSTDYVRKKIDFWMHQRTVCVCVCAGGCVLDKMNMVVGCKF